MSSGQSLRQSLAVMAFVAIFAADLRVSDEVAVWFGYLVPILLAGSFPQPGAMQLAAVLAMLLTVVAQLFSWPFQAAVLINRASAVVVFCVIGALTLRLRRRELDLRTLDARTTALLDNGTSVAWLKDEDGRYVYLSQSCLKRFKLTADAVWGKTDHDLFPRETAEVYRRNDLMVLASGGPEDLLEEVIDRSGRRSWWRCRKFVFRDAAGRKHVGGLAHDVTAEQRLETMLRVERSALQMGATGQSYSAAFDVVARGVESLLPRALCSILLVDEEGTRLVPVSAPSLPAEYISALRNVPIGPSTGLGAAAARGETVMVEDITVDPHWASYRDLATESGLLALCAIPFRNSSGRVLGVLALHYRVAYRHDDDEIRVAETAARLASLVVVRKSGDDALRESEARYALVVRGTRSGIWSWNVKTKQLYCSPRLLELVDLPSHEFDSDRNVILERVHPDDLRTFTDGVSAHFKSRVPFDVEVRLRAKNGSYRWCRASGQATWDEQGQPLRMAGSLTDITESKAALAALRDSEERPRSLSRQLLEAQETERRRIARDLHDQVGQNLSALKLTLAGLQRHGNEEVRAVLLSEGLGVTEQILRQIRSLALDLRPSVLDDLGLAPAIEWCLERATSRAGLQVQYRCDERLPKIEPAVGIACFRILQEATTNCLRHARASRLDVTLRVDDGDLELVCADDGVGFDVSKALREASLGRCLGLLSMRERAELVGGRVSVNSEAGSGTVLQALFPLALTSVAHASASILEESA